MFEKNLDQPFTPLKLRIETFMFRSTRFETIQLYMSHFSDLTYLTSLSLFRIDFNKTNFDYLIRLMSTRLPNLHTLSTDMLQGKNLDECLLTTDTEHNLRLVLSRLSEIYLWECDSIYDILPSSVDCACRLKKRNCFSSYDYSFSLFDFSRLFGRGRGSGEMGGCGWMSARKVVVLFVQICFCDVTGRPDKKSIDSVVDLMRHGAKSLDYLEMRFKCSRCNKFFVKYFNDFSA